MNKRVDERRSHRDCMRRWAKVETVAELGELGALWLEGEIPSQPGYTELCGPDEETEHLISVLARLNRGGYFTCGSQPGLADEAGWDGQRWWQRAAVDGFVDDVDVLAAIQTAVRGTSGLRVVVNATPRWSLRSVDHRCSLPVTRAGDHPCTWFGARLSRRYLRFLYGDTGALDALFGAWQVTVVDLEWGRDDLLWPVLDEALAPKGRQR